MTGSDSEEAGHVSQADLATFRQDLENEMAQLFVMTLHFDSYMSIRDFMC